RRRPARRRLSRPLHLGHRLAASQHAGRGSRRRAHRGHDPAHRADGGTATQAAGYQPRAPLLVRLSAPATGEYSVLFEPICRRAALIVIAAVVAQAAPAAAQEEEDGWRYRVSAGAQVRPQYPGADEVSPLPMFDVDRARGDEPFRFEA